MAAIPVVGTPLAIVGGLALAMAGSAGMEKLQEWGLPKIIGTTTPDWDGPETGIVIAAYGLQLWSTVSPSTIMLNVPLPSIGSSQTAAT